MDTSIVSLVTFAGIASSAGACLLGVRDLLFPPRQRQVTLRGAMHSLPSADSQEGTGIFARFDHWFERTLYLAMPGMSAFSATLMLILVAFAMGSAVFVASESLPLSCLSALLGMCGMMAFLVLAKRRRLKRFQEQFPTALDLMARAVRAGESVEAAFEIVAGAVRDPVANEFRLCAQQLQLGLSMSATMKSLTDRIDLIDVRIFSSALSVHRHSGGNVSVTVERLAEVIRERMEFHRQLKSVTGAGRLSVMLILTLGPVLFAYLFFFQPEYGQGLWNDPLGRRMLLFAAISQAIGLAWVMQVLRKEY